MSRLLANVETAVEQEFVLGIFPPNFYRGLIGSSVYYLLALVFFAIAIKFIDWITPGDLGDQLLGKAEGLNGKPNIALAIVAGALIIAFGEIIAAAIH